MKAKVVEYHVQSPYTNNENGHHYPLVPVLIRESTIPVMTKTGLNGRAIKATIYFHNGKKTEGTAVWADEGDWEYQFAYGAKLALERALKDCCAREHWYPLFWKGFEAHVGWPTSPKKKYEPHFPYQDLETWDPIGEELLGTETLKKIDEWNKKARKKLKKNKKKGKK